MPQYSYAGFSHISAIVLPLSRAQERDEQRKLGELIIAQKETVGLGKPGPKLNTQEESNYRPTLADASAGALLL